MRTPFIALLIFLSAATVAQRQYKYFFGQVLDQSTLRPLTGVNISFQGLKQGSITDKKGEFSFFLDTIPVYMVVSHMGYETKRIWLDGTSPKMSIRLSPAVLELKEVEIVAKAGPEVFYKDEDYAVLDYEVDSSRVYLLIYRFTLAASELLCKTIDGNPVATSPQFAFRPDSLFKDCLGNVHVLSHDSCYQVFTDSSGIHLIYPTTMEKFETVLKNCVASTTSKLFIKKITNDGFGIDFYRVDRVTRANERVASVVDEENLRRLSRNEDDYGRIRSSTIPDGRAEFQEWNFARKIMYRPRTASMVRIGENICVFNTADMTIEFYTPEGDFTSKLKFDLSKAAEGKWTKEILVDVVRNKVYTSFNRNGEFTLYLVNLETGSLVRSSRLTHIYPQNLKVQDGKVFYMYNLPGEPDNKQLFKQTLSAF
jgi:hypothetical protein